MPNTKKSDQPTRPAKRTLTDQERELLKYLREEEHRRRCRDELLYFAGVAVQGLAKPGETHVPEKHHRLLLNKLQEVAEGKITRLMVFMPPGTAKSTYTSKIFPAWLMATQPRCQIIGASNTALLANDFSVEVNAMLERHQHELGTKPTSIRADKWETDNGSSYYSVGVGGTVTGFRADYLIIDDPIKSAQEAYSEASRASVRKWYNGDAYTRIKPTGAVIIMHTRWHVDDLAGQLLEEQRGDWHILNLPAIWDREEDEPSWPDGMGRKQGELLWPSYHNEDFYRRARKTLGERDFSAMYQQSPTVADGSLVQVNNIKAVDLREVPEAVDTVRAWDIASTERMGTKSPDYTVGTLWQRNKSGGWTVLDVVRQQSNPEQVEALIRKTAEADGPSVRISLPQDPGAAGKIVASHFTRMLAGYNVRATTESGSKLVRATPMAAQMNAGEVKLLRASWNKEYLEELSMFPGGRNDDQVDASSRAFSELIEPEHSAPFISTRGAGFWRH